MADRRRGRSRWVSHTGSVISKGKREVWVDVGKAACIVLVVAWHVATKSASDVGFAGAAWWVMAMNWLAPIRMPLFFFLSGLLFARTVRSPDVLSRTWRRGGALFRVHAVWVIVYMAFFAVVPLSTVHATSLRSLVLYIAWGASSLWYLYALCMYMVLAVIVTRVPWLGLLLAGAMTLAGLVWESPIGNSSSMLTCAPWFLWGVWHALQQGGGRTPPFRSTTFISAGVLVAGGWLTNTSGVELSALRLLLGVAGVVVGLALVHWAARSPGVAAAATVVAPRTLTLYVLHLPLLAISHLVIRACGGVPPWLGPWYPLIATSLLVAVCVGLDGLLKRSLLRRLVTL